MKKIVFSFAAVLATTVGLISWKTMQTGGGAIVKRGDYCDFVTKKTGDLGLTRGTFQYVYTPSGNATLVCKGQVNNTTGKAYQITPEDRTEPCYIEGVTPKGAAGKTNDWKVTVSASGQATAVCHWK